VTKRPQKKTPTPPASAAPAAPAAPATTERIARRIARAGICSRRDAEKLIAAERVTVNGTVITSPALNVTARDAITIDGAALPQAEPTRLFRLHKPKGRITSARDPEGRPTIYEDLPFGMPRLITVGRLDFNTEGLLLMTNDGALARALELPSTGWPRHYRVRAFGTVDEAALARLADGITLEGIHYGPIDAKLESSKGANAWLTLTISEGKNREVRNVLAHLGLTVNRLIRVSFGPFQLSSLITGAIEEVPRHVLIEHCGPLLSGSADALVAPDASPARPANKRAPGKKPRRKTLTAGKTMDASKTPGAVKPPPPRHRSPKATKPSTKNTSARNPTQNSKGQTGAHRRRTP
jgi:23S rRNA pseudouridine2605 synthase